MARGIYGLPKVSPGPAMPDPSTPCRLAMPEMARWLFLGLPARRTGGLRPSSTPLDTPFGPVEEAGSAGGKDWKQGAGHCRECMR
jgi:hypothetical protein